MVEVKNDRKYLTSSPVIIFAFIVVTYLGSLGIVKSPNSSFDFAPLVYLALMYAVLIDLKFGIYVSISSGKFSQVFDFLQRSSIEVAQIGRISFMPTWIIGQNHRSLYIIDGKTNKVVTKMANTAYAPRTLAEIVRELKRLNPSIELDTDTQALLSKYNPR
jgi:hypothetical protein